MRKLTLLTSVLLASSFQTVNVSAQCMNTINCQTLGYTKTSCTKGGVKCPTGNYWYCPKDTTTPQCSSSYKYTCTGTYQSPSGTACNGKYQKCNCSNNYVWNSTQGRCLAGSGSGSGSDSGSGNTCQNTVEYKVNYTTSCFCDTVGGQYSLIQMIHYVCEQGISPSTPDWHTRTSLGRYARESQCQNALNENSSECTGSGSIYPSTIGRPRCGHKCID